MQSLLVVLATLSAVALAAPSTPAATCVTSAANSTETSWAMGYAAVSPPVSGSGYDIDAAFQASYGFNTTMEISMTHTSNMSDYASFKCQYACNGNSGCVAFFGRFVDVDTDQERFQCLSFKAVLDNSCWTETTSNMANGGYNKLCG